METHGKKLTSVLKKAWLRGFSVQSNFFRQNSAYVALAASEGLITTAIPGETFGTVWRITPQGCDLLFNEKEPDV